MSPKKNLANEEGKIYHLDYAQVGWNKCCFRPHGYPSLESIRNRDWGGATNRNLAEMMVGILISYKTGRIRFWTKRNCLVDWLSCKQKTRESQLAQEFVTGTSCWVEVVGITWGLMEMVNLSWSRQWQMQGTKNLVQSRLKSKNVVGLSTLNQNWMWAWTKSGLVWIWWFLKTFATSKLTIKNLLT